VLGPQLPRLERKRPTRERPLPGALPPQERDELLAEVGATLDTAQAARLWGIYGAAARRIAELACSEPELATTLDASQTLVAELVYAREVEWAVTLDDILQRRCMAGLKADFGLGAAEPAARWLVRLGVWDSARAESELANYRARAARQRALPAN
jgi:glycerol-3-phosphate dehydrogenase